MFGAILGTVASGLIGSAFAKKNAKAGAKIDRGAAKGMLEDRFEVGAEQGLTPQEAMGISSNTSTGAATSTLGNQAAQIHKQIMDQRFAQSERDKDRAVQLRAQDMSLESAKTSAGASMYGANVNAATQANALALQRERFNQVEMPDALRRAVTESPTWKRSELLARMGVDNILGTSIAQMYGVNPMDASQVKAMSPEAFQRMASTIYGMQSNAFGESAGAGLAINNAMSGFGAALPTMGQGSGSSVRR
jgi:hypothetical protein